MYEGPLKPITNREDWNVSFELTDDETGDLLDLTGASVLLQARSRENYLTVLTASLGSGITNPSTGVIAVSIPASSLWGLCAGTYDVGCTVTMSNGAVFQLIIGQLPIFDGVTNQ